MPDPELPGSADAGFDLYDLRVEVVGPPDKQIYCAAKIGDYFDLHGEMLILPPGQGFSIYSLAALLPARQAASHPSERLDEHRCRSGLPRSQLSHPFPHKTHGHPPFPALCRDCCSLA